jgi:hypothetical protein
MVRLMVEWSAHHESTVARTEAELGPVTILVANGVAWQGTLDTYDQEQVARMRRVCGRGATGGSSM